MINLPLNKVWFNLLTSLQHCSEHTWQACWVCIWPSRAYRGSRVQKDWTRVPKQRQSHQPQERWCQRSWGSSWWHCCIQAFHIEPVPGRWGLGIPQEPQGVPRSRFLFSFHGPLRQACGTGELSSHPRSQTECPVLSGDSELHLYPVQNSCPQQPPCGDPWQWHLSRQTKRLSWVCTTLWL